MVWCYFGVYSDLWYKIYVPIYVPIYITHTLNTKHIPQRSFKSIPSNAKLFWQLVPWQSAHKGEHSKFPACAFCTCTAHAYVVHLHQSLAKISGRAGGRFVGIGAYFASTNFQLHSSGLRSLNLQAWTWWKTLSLLLCVAAIVGGRDFGCTKLLLLGPLLSLYFL